VGRKGAADRGEAFLFDSALWAASRWHFSLRLPPTVRHSGHLNGPRTEPRAIVTCLCDRNMSKCAAGFRLVNERFNPRPDPTPRRRRVPTPSSAGRGLGVRSVGVEVRDEFGEARQCVPRSRIGVFKHAEDQDVPRTRLSEVHQAWFVRLLLASLALNPVDQ